MFKKILSAITLLLVVFVAWNVFTASSGVVVTEELSANYPVAVRFTTEVNQVEYLTFLGATIYSLNNINIIVLLLLIPEQILMYYAAGQIYFAFLRQRKDFKISQAKLTRISLEINFVNHALPSGGASGLAYLIWRLKDYKVSAGQISFIHILRYGICAVGNALQTIIAIIIVLATHQVIQGGFWALWLAAFVAFGIIGLIIVAWLIVRKQKNIDWLSATATKFINKVVRKISRGKKRKFLKEENVTKFFADLREDYLNLKKNRRILWKPMIWGLFYSFLELATYWVVGCALGHPEILPQIMIAEGIASVVGTVMVTPGGMGGYEGAFVAALVATGVGFQVATITVVVTRIFVLVGTVVSGWGFYQQALMSREDKFIDPSEKKKD
ncbi:MAG: lysylphosphatidylglycerol synthase transmembrane domain-containing protein [Candidatus Saccharibacteria bacterium]|nr:lysylphosphatidylglycerol synthase transmembrane domain-containing protein [Candidatus Saccharibacteria bacterium]